MKRILALIFAVTMIFTIISACGNDENLQPVQEQPEYEETPNYVPETIEEELPPGTVIHPEIDEDSDEPQGMMPVVVPYPQASAPWENYLPFVQFSDWQVYNLFTSAFRQGQTLEDINAIFDQEGWSEEPYLLWEWTELFNNSGDVFALLGLDRTTVDKMILGASEEVWVNPDLNMDLERLAEMNETNTFEEWVEATGGYGMLQAWTSFSGFPNEGDILDEFFPPELETMTFMWVNEEWFFVQVSFYMDGTVAQIYH